MKEQLVNFFAKLSLLRVLRFGLGVFMGIQAFHGQDVLAGVLSVVLLWQAYSNVGCAWGACNVPERDVKRDVEVGEVKGKK